jgi:hypothetical protein
LVLLFEARAHEGVALVTFLTNRIGVTGFHFVLLCCLGGAAAKVTPKAI